MQKFPSNNYIATNYVVSCGNKRSNTLNFEGDNKKSQKPLLNIRYHFLSKKNIDDLFHMHKCQVLQWNPDKYYF